VVGLPAMLVDLDVSALARWVVRATSRVRHTVSLRVLHEHDTSEFTTRASDSRGVCKICL
jgi:hypothetical protein